MIIPIQSVCAEMASELKFVLRCNTRQRPAWKVQTSNKSTNLGITCNRCNNSSRNTSIRRNVRYTSNQQQHQHEQETTYVPSIDVPWLNGVSLVLPATAIHFFFFFLFFFTHTKFIFIIFFHALYILTIEYYLKHCYNP